MTRRGSGALVPAPEWPTERLDADRRAATTRFREARIGEPLERYLELFALYDTHVAHFLDATNDLATLDHQASSLLAKPELLEIFRYLAGPPISADDLRVVAAGRAVLVSWDLERPEALLQRVVREESTAQRVAEIEDDLDRLERLD